MKMTRDKLRQLARDGYYTEGINDPAPPLAPVTKPRKKKKKPEVTIQETSAAPTPKKENGPKKWRFDVVRDTSGFILAVDATQIPQE